MKSKIFKIIGIYAVGISCIVMMLISCVDEEANHRKKYWTDSNYPKYGVMSINMIPDSLQQEYLETIKNLAWAGRAQGDSSSVNGLKYAKEIVDPLFFRSVEGLSIYLGEHQRVEIPYYQLDSTQKWIFNQLKFGTPSDTLRVALK